MADREARTMAKTPTPRTRLLPLPLPASPDLTPHQDTSPSRTLFLLIITLVLVLFEFGDFLMVVPRMQLYEEIICAQQGNKTPKTTASLHELDSPRCEIGDRKVVAEVALIVGNQGFFDALPSILFSIPYGQLADRRGYRPVLLLSCVGIFLAFVWQVWVCRMAQSIPLRTVWLSSIFMAIGGGASVMTAMVFSAVANAVESAQRVKIFSYIGVALLGAELIATPLGSALILWSGNAWLPMLLGLAVVGLATMLVSALPDIPHPPGENTGSEALSGQNFFGEHEEADLAEPNRQCADSVASGVLGRMKTTLCDDMASLKFLFQNFQLVILLSTFLVRMLGRASMNVLLQYAGEALGWSVARAGFLLTLRTITSINVLLLFLPGLSWLLHEKLNVEAWRTNLYLMRGSIATLAVGNVVIGSGPRLAVLIFGLAVSTLGVGLSTIVRSLVAELVEPGQRASVYTAAGVLETLGSLAAGPALAAGLRMGLSWGGPWLGMPFLGLGFIYSMLFLFTWLLKARANE